MKKLSLGLLSFLLMSSLVWGVLLFNPQVMYSKSTVIDQVTVYHHDALDPAAADVIRNAIDIVKRSPLYKADEHLNLCINDQKRYKELWIYKGGIAYSFLNKAVLYWGIPDWKENVARYDYSNGTERRKVDLTWLIAHEFAHNMQYAQDPWFPLSTDFWKSEGDAEYVSRQWADDGRLQEKLAIYLEEESRAEGDYPIIIAEDGTNQGVFYYKCALMVQYLYEVEGLSFAELKNEQRSMDEIWSELLSKQIQRDN